MITINPFPPVNASATVESISTTAEAEGDGTDLLYTVNLDQTTADETSFSFSITGDAIGANKNRPNQVDALTGNNVTLTKVNQQWWRLHHHPCWRSIVYCFCPVVDDTIIKHRNSHPSTAPSGIGQIFDNDSLPLNQTQTQM